VSGQAARTAICSRAKPGFADRAAHDKKEIESVPGNRQGPDQGDKNQYHLRPTIRTWEKLESDEDEHGKGYESKNSIPFR
jgi:hypothetical protein